MLLVMQIPFCVVIGWMMGTEMDLNFQLFETATLFITVLVVAFMLQVCFHTGLMSDIDLHTHFIFVTIVMLFIFLLIGILIA